MQTQPVQGFVPTPIMFPEYQRDRLCSMPDGTPAVNMAVTCQQVLDEGGCTVDEFFDKLDALIDQWPDA
ncbi:MAG: hypothetical protein LBR57_02455 [Alistipes sp.]|nr:hypothetical protein [Alistipes sp.]